MTIGVHYRGYVITWDPPPIPNWQRYAYSWAHEEIDGAPDSGDHRCGCSSSLAAAYAAIDELEDDRDEHELERALFDAREARAMKTYGGNW